jgi:hypothetical protein
MNRGIDKTNTFEQTARMIKLQLAKCIQKYVHIMQISVALQQ